LMGQEVRRWRKIPVLTENRNAVGHAGFRVRSQYAGSATYMSIL
jgi:hypothetical protein